MFYRFNSLTGRLVNTGLKKVLGTKQAGEQVPILYDSTIKFSRIPDQEMKAGRKTGSILYGEVPESLKEKQRHFQEDNGIPVHLKGGGSDQMLMGLTFLLCAVGLFESFRLYYVMSFPQKPDDEC